ERGVPHGAPVELLAAQEGLDGRERGRAERRKADRPDRAGAAELAQHANRKRVTQAVHPGGGAVELEFGECRAGADVEDGRGEPDRVRPRGHDTAEDNDLSTSLPTEFLCGRGISSATPPANYDRR